MVLLWPGRYFLACFIYLYVYIHARACTLSFMCEFCCNLSQSTLSGLACCPHYGAYRGARVVKTVKATVFSFKFSARANKMRVIIKTSIKAAACRRGFEPVALSLSRTRLAVNVNSALSVSITAATMGAG